MCVIVRLAHGRAEGWLFPEFKAFERGVCIADASTWRHCGFRQPYSIALLTAFEAE
jgi:hypothetical protein